jgi:hypothetical protein
MRGNFVFSTSYFIFIFSSANLEWFKDFKGYTTYRQDIAFCARRAVCFYAYKNRMSKTFTSSVCTVKKNRIGYYAYIYILKG